MLAQNTFTRRVVKSWLMSCMHVASSFPPKGSNASIVRARFSACWSSTYRCSSRSESTCMSIPPESPASFIDLRRATMSAVVS